MSRPAADLDVVAVGSWTNFDHLFEVASLPAPGDTVQICSPVDDVERVYFGGCAPNVAVAAARLGARSALVSVVGDDFEARGYATHLDECGVDRRAVQVIPGERCGHSFMFRDADGYSVCISQIGVAARQEEFAPDPAILAAASVAVITYRFDRFTLKAAELARAGGAQVLLSGALATAPDLAAAFVGRANMLVCTEHELAQLVSMPGLDDEHALLDAGLSAIVCTRGAGGVAWQTPKFRGQVPAVAARRVLDSTGAGDGFVAGLAVGLAQGQTLPEAIRLGASVASFVVEAVGCQTNLPSLPAAQARLATMQRQVRAQA
ncbi:MAG: PfkB family carbohydrate kinase [Anaerolineaceae bacterium]|nr:PfkB family carbohydrate kinase [Anaerolineaceae bacterium]